MSTGDRVGEYAIRELLDSGGSGIVYAAVHTRTGRLAAIKVLRSEFLGSVEMVERFLREARAIDHIRHPCIVHIFDAGRLPDGRPFLIMELLVGSSLRQLRKQHGAFSPEEVLAVMTPICEALEAVHAAGYIHRDLKSSNVIVSADRKRITLLDFGIAKFMHPTPSQSGLTSVGHPMGTPHAMAPEQILGGQVDARTDVYALGILTYELLTARLPFMSGNRSEIERMHLRSEPPRPSRDVPVPPAVDDVVLRCLAKAPCDRYGSPRDFLAALHAAITSRASVAPASPASECDALGVFVEVQPRDSSYDEVADEVLDLLLDALDVAEDELDGAGFIIPLQTSNSLLGVLLVQDDARATSETAMATAHHLHELMMETAGVAEELCIVVTVHIDRVCVTGDGEHRSLSGPLLRITEWPGSAGAPVRATPPVAGHLSVD